MPLISVNCTADRMAAALPGAPLQAQVAAALAGMAVGTPAIVMIHGFRFSARHPQTDPHRHILSLTPRDGARRAVSWPRHLGFGRGDADASEPAHEGLCVAFGWEARGTLWHAYAEAERAGAGLARLVRMIREVRPDVPVNVLAHSLGARVLLSALPGLLPGSIGRAVLMAAAEFQTAAQAALATPAGAATEVINITTRENDLFDLALELLVPGGGRALGLGLGQPKANWLDVQVDQTATLQGLAALGHRIGPPDLRVCHWSPYLRPGLFGLYRTLLREPGTLSLAQLRGVLPQVGEPRWTRLREWPKSGLSLPRMGKAPS